MTYEEFKIRLMDHLQTDISDPKSISIQPITRNNGLVLDGLVIMEGDYNVAPTIYLNPYYEQYTAGASFVEVYSNLLDVYQKNRPDGSLNIRFFTDFEIAKEHIAFKIIHRHRNEALLKDIPYIPFLDLAVVYYCLLENDLSRGHATILIRNCHLDYWQISKETLHELAKYNTPRLLKQSLRDIYEVIYELAKNTPFGDNLSISEDAFVSEHPDPDMFILSNHENLFGAACILYQGLLKQYAAKTDSDFYILPSSVHEVILVPAHSRKNLKELSEMVYSINQNAVLPEEILSDHAYYYSREEDRIVM